MAFLSYLVPNWAQKQLAVAAGLDPTNVAVEMENECQIVFLQYLPRQRVMVSKADGSILKKQDPYADSRANGRQSGQLKIPQ